MQAIRAGGMIGAVVIQGALLVMLPSQPPFGGAVQAKPMGLSIMYQSPAQVLPALVRKQAADTLPLTNPQSVKKNAAISPKHKPFAKEMLEEVGASDVALEKKTAQSVSERAAPLSKLVSQAQGLHKLVITEPLFAESPVPPDYPQLARKRGQQGTVWVEVMLDASGAQLTADIYQSSGVSLLDRSALQAVRQWQFIAHRINNIAVASHVRIPVEFSLE